MTSHINIGSGIIRERFAQLTFSKALTAICHLYSRCMVSWELSYLHGVMFAGTIVVLITPLITRSVI